MLILAAGGHGPTDASPKQTYFKPPLILLIYMQQLFESWRKHLLNERYSIETSLAAIRADNNKKMYKAYKRFIEDAHNRFNPYDPIDNIEKKIRRASAKYRTHILDLIPEDIYGPSAQSQEQKRKEADKNQGLAIMWIRKLSMEDSELMRAIIEGDVSDFRSQWSDVMPDLETYFQNLDLMPKKNLIELESLAELHDIVEKAKPEIAARQEKKQYLDAEEGTEVLKEDEYLFIAALHNKGAACELGKGTDWCTAASGLDYFSDYYEPDDPLFFFRHYGDRYQFHYGSKQFMDDKDRPIEEHNPDLFRYFHNQLMQTEAPEKYSVLRNYNYNLVAGDPKTSPETLDNIVEEFVDRQLSQGTGWTSSVLQKVAKNPSTPIETLRRLHRSTHDKYIVRNVQMNQQLHQDDSPEGMKLAKEIFLMNLSDQIIFDRGLKQAGRWVKAGIMSKEEVSKAVEDHMEAEELRKKARTTTLTLRENKIIIRVKNS